MNDLRVERMAVEARAEVVAVLSAAFVDYPVMRYVVGREGSRYRVRLEELIGHFCDRRFARGWPVLGALVDGVLVGVATVNPPRPQPAPAALRESFERLREALGDAAIARLEAFEAASDGNEPPYPHHFVGMLGVHPEHQGRGHARVLLDAVQDLSRADPESTAVALSTEESDNLAFYRHLGFELIGDTRVGELQTWGLARRDCAGNGPA